MKASVTVLEWGVYIDSLSREELWTKAQAANSFAFTRKLLNEGMEMGQVEAIVSMFARRMFDLEMKVPEGGAFPLYAMTQTGPLRK